MFHRRKRAGGKWPDIFVEGRMHVFIPMRKLSARLDARMLRRKYGSSKEECHDLKPEDVHLHFLGVLHNAKRAEGGATEEEKGGLRNAVRCNCRCDSSCKSCPEKRS